MQRMLVKFIWVVWSPGAIIVFIDVTRHMDVLETLCIRMCTTENVVLVGKSLFCDVTQQIL
jgi:hypothetical protein